MLYIFIMLGYGEIFLLLCYNWKKRALISLQLNTPPHLYHTNIIIILNNTCKKVKKNAVAATIQHVVLEWFHPRWIHDPIS